VPAQSTEDLTRMKHNMLDIATRKITSTSLTALDLGLLISINATINKSLTKEGRVFFQFD
jgi:hypothetical protein